VIKIAKKNTNIIFRIEKEKDIELVAKLNKRGINKSKFFRSVIDDELKSTPKNPLDKQLDKQFNKKKVFSK